jgi:octaprenyl-diphosphate synthase
MLELGQQFGVLGQTLAGDLAEVESRFAAELISDLACVNDLARHLEQYRGKMLRPTLVLLTGYATAPDTPATHEHLTVATVVEMIHMATLVHDDVLDESQVRRRGKTINHLQGNEAAVMLGDYLISHAYHLCSSLDNSAIARLVASTTNTVCEGELLQLTNRDNWSLDEQTYFQIIRRKTASLCGVSNRLGASLAGADRAAAEALEQYGEKLGMAFQIIDDVLDLTGDPAVVGKSLGKDLEKGKLTLPLIHQLETANPARRQQLLDTLRSTDRDRHHRMAHYVIESDALHYARRRAEDLVHQARSHLTVLSESPARRMLSAMADAVISRNH